MPTPPEPVVGRGLRRSVATVCLSGTLEDKLAAAAAAGFDGVEIFENDLVTSSSSPADVARRAADLGLAIDLYQPFRDFEAVPDAVFRDNLRRAERKFDVMEQLGADTILVCSSVAPDAVDDDALAAGQLTELAERASARGLRIAYEALAWGRHVSTWDHSWQIVQRAAHPALGVCLDSFHILSRFPSADGRRRAAGRQGVLPPAGRRPAAVDGRAAVEPAPPAVPGAGRLRPGGLRRGGAGHGLPRAAVARGLQRRVPPGRPRPHRDRRDAVAAGARGGPAPAAGCTRDSTRTGTSRLRLHRARSRRSLRTRGGQHPGCAGFHPHRPAPVQAGAAVGAGPGARSCSTRPSSAPRRHRGWPPSARWRSRATTPRGPPPARRRCWPRPCRAAAASPRPTSPRSARPTTPSCSSAAPGGRGWRDDFLPTGAADDAVPGCCTSTTSPSPSRSTTSTRPGCSTESVLGSGRKTPAESSPRRSGSYARCALRDPPRRLRLALSVSLLRRGEWAPGVPDPQHIAFGTDDIVATAAHLRAHGAAAAAGAAELLRRPRRPARPRA